VDTAPLLNFEGVNNFGTVLNNTLNTLTAIIRNRLSSIINEQLVTPKANQILKNVLSIIP
jgi:hypothetical protein